MKNADSRNNIDANSKPSFRTLGKSPILRAAKLRAASVPGAVAFLMGLTSISNSSAKQIHFSNLKLKKPPNLEANRSGENVLNDLCLLSSS